MRASALRILLILGVAALPGLCAPPAGAQTDPTPSAPPPELQAEAAAAATATPSSDVIQIERRPAIPFEPFAMLDPATGQPAHPQTLLTLPDGRRITARRYYRELNRLEQGFNAFGYSLRDPEPNVLLGSNFVHPERLGRETEVRIAIPEKDQVAEKATRTWHTDWSRELGDPEIFAAYFNGALDLNGSIDTTSFHGVSHAGGTVFGTRKEVIGLTTDLNAPKTGTMTATFRLAVLGTTVYNLNPSTAVSWSTSGNISRSVDVGADVRFTVGPIPMRARMGFRGNGGARYALYLDRVSAEAWVRPFVNSDAYMQVGADIVVGGVGAGATMVLLDLTLDFYGLAALEQDAQGAPYLHVRTYALENLTALKGEVYCYAWMYVPTWRGWFFYLKKKTWTYEMWDSPGVQASNVYLFSQDQRLYL